MRRRPFFVRVAAEVRRPLDERVELFAGVAGVEPIGNILAGLPVAFRWHVPVRRIDNSYTRCNADQVRSGGCDVISTGLIVVPGNNHIGSPKHFAVLTAPLRSLAGLGSAVRTA